VSKNIILVFKLPT